MILLDGRAQTATVAGAVAVNSVLTPVNQNFNSTIGIAIPATTTAQWPVVLFMGSSGLAPATLPTNFVEIGDASGGSLARHLLYAWNGTGTRPSSTTLSFTNFGGTSSSQACSLVGLILDGIDGLGVHGEVTNQVVSTGNNLVGPTLTLADANSLVLHVGVIRSDTTISATPAPAFSTASPMVYPEDSALLRYGSGNPGGAIGSAAREPVLWWGVYGGSFAACQFTIGGGGATVGAISAEFTPA